MLEAVVFYTVGGLLLAAALCVIASPQPIYSVLSLLLAMFFLAILFVMLGAYFVAALQILLYAGAVLVLFLFVIMLLNLKPELLPHVGSTYRRTAAIVAASAFCAQIIWFATRSRVTEPPGAPAAPVGDVAQIGRLLFSKYLLPFEFTSFLILAAIIGAITLAGTKSSQR